MIERVERAVSFSEWLTEAEDGKRRVEALRLARAVVLAGLPKRRTNEQHIERVLRLGQNMWLKVTHVAAPGKELPFGEDRFVLAGIQHLALESESPIVTFERAGQLLKMFGISEGGRNLRLLRERFKRLAGLSIILNFASSEDELNEGMAGQQSFIIKKYALPTRKDLSSEKAGQSYLEELGSPYGVMLSEDFWSFLQESKNWLIMPLDLLRLFIDRPTGWDYACFLVARCGSARSLSFVPHEALMSLFKDSVDEADRHVIRRLQKYHTEIQVATGGRLNADLVEDSPLRSASGGRPKKRWSLKVGPSKNVLGNVKRIES